MKDTVAVHVVLAITAYMSTLALSFVTGMLIHVRAYFLAIVLGATAVFCFIAFAQNLTALGG